MPAVLAAWPVVAGLVALGGAVFVGYRVGVRVTARRINRVIRNDREVGIAVLEDLAMRWGVKIERTETPGSP